MLLFDLGSVIKLLNYASIYKCHHFRNTVNQNVGTRPVPLSSETARHNTYLHDKANCFVLAHKHQKSVNEKKKFMRQNKWS